MQVQREREVDERTEIYPRRETTQYKQPMETKIFIPSTHQNFYRQEGYLDQHRACTATQNGTSGHGWQEFFRQGYQILRTHPSKPATKQGHSIGNQPLDNGNYGRDEFEGVATATDGNFDLPSSSESYMGGIQSPRNTKKCVVSQSHVTDANQSSPVGLVPWQSKGLAVSSSPSYRHQRHDASSHVSGREKLVFPDGSNPGEVHQHVIWRPCLTDPALEPVKFGIDSTLGIRRSELPTVHSLCETAESVNMLGTSPETERHSSRFNGARKLIPISVPPTQVTNTICTQEAFHHPCTNVSYHYQPSGVRPPRLILNSDHHHVHHQLVTQKGASRHSGLAKPHHDPDIEVAHQARGKCGTHSTKAHGNCIMTGRQVIKDQQVRQQNAAFISDSVQPVRYHSHPSHPVQEYTRTSESVSTKRQKLDYYTAGRHFASDSGRQRLIVDDRFSTQPAPKPQTPPVSLALNPNSFPYEKRPFYVSVNAGQELASYVVNFEAALKASGEKRKKKGTEKFIACDSIALPPTKNPSNVVLSNGGVKKDVLSSIRLERVYYTMCTTQGQVDYTTSKLMPASSEP